MKVVGDRVGLEPKYALTNFAGELAGVQSGRYDLGMCVVYWTKERTAKGLFTDPIYYSPIEMLQASDSSITNVTDLEGKRIGVVTGFSWNPAMEAVPGATVRTYQDYSTLIADLAAGRIDVAPTIPLVNSEAIANRPELEIESKTLEVPTEEEVSQHPEYIGLRPSQVTWYLEKGNSELAERFNQAITEIYTNGKLAGVLERYGVDPTVWLVPPGEYIAKERRGVDRPADWQPPTISE